MMIGIQSNAAVGLSGVGSGLPKNADAQYVAAQKFAVLKSAVDLVKERIAKEHGDLSLPVGTTGVGGTGGAGGTSALPPSNIFELNALTTSTSSQKVDLEHLRSMRDPKMQQINNVEVQKARVMMVLVGSGIVKDGQSIEQEKNELMALKNLTGNPMNESAFKATEGILDNASKQMDIFNTEIMKLKREMDG